jgi:hypothetical protein
MIVLWNTIYVEAVLEQSRKEGYPVNEENKARLSPLIHEHINTQGRRSFVMPERWPRGNCARCDTRPMIWTEGIAASGHVITAKHRCPTRHIALAYPGFPSICYSTPKLTPGFDLSQD